LLAKAVTELKQREKKGEKNLRIKYIDNTPKCVVSNTVNNNNKNTPSSSTSKINNFQI